MSLSGRGLEQSDGSLCHGCIQLCEQRKKAVSKALEPTTPVSIEVHSTFATLRNCADRGCQGCRGLYKLILRGFVTTISDLKELNASPNAVRAEWGRREGNLIIRLGRNSNKSSVFVPNDGDRSGEFVQAVAASSRNLRQNNDTNISKNEVLPVESLSAVLKRWMDECRNHPRCTETLTRVAANEMPTRLVCLLPSSKEHSQPDIRLIETQGQVLSYCALSYVWGDQANNFGVTTPANVFQRRQGFYCSALPKTARDVIDICRSLGIQYVWIDALCIIQGDAADWEHEAPRMQYVYGNSALTIAAVAASHANEGIFHRGPNWQSEISSLNLDGFRYTFNDGVCDIAPLMGPRRSREFGHLGAPIFGRAWTLQEVEMSPRVLYWTFHGVIGVCQMGACSELEMRMPELHYVRLDLLQDKDSLELLPLTPAPQTESALLFWDETSPNKALAYWEKVVRLYGRRRLTKASDRLPAISGIASLLSKTINSDYVAGFWRHMLPEHLLWQADQESLVLERGSNSRVVPSWSWANLPAETFFFPWTFDGNEDSTTMCKVLNISVGPLVEAGFSGMGPRLYLQGRLSCYNQWSELLPSPFIDATSRVFRGKVGRPTGTCTVCPDIMASHSDIERLIGECHVLIIMINDKSLSLRGLLLLQAADVIEGPSDKLCFRRVGYLEAFFHDHAAYAHCLCSIAQHDSMLI